MSREVDRRDPKVNRATAARRAELESRAREVSEKLPGEHKVEVVGVDRSTGNPPVVASTGGPKADGDYVERALAHLRGVGRALGLAAGQPNEYAADPDFHRTSSGAVTVHLRQLYKGIPIFEAAQAVRFAPGGELKETWGRSVTVDEDRPAEPKLSANEAVRRAAAHVAVPAEDEYGQTDQFGEPVSPVAVDVEGFKPRVRRKAPEERPDRPTVLYPGPFAEDVRANLVWFDLDGSLRLTWEVVAVLPGHTDAYRTLVDAETGEILYCRQLAQFALGRGNVYRVDGGSAREMVDFPQPLASYGLPLPGDLPEGFPDDWVAEASTEGNCATARLGLVGKPLAGAADGDRILFDPDPEGDEQKVVNLFYYACTMHDFFYLLGFREAAGNFQSDNFGRGGSGGDAVSARVHTGSVPGTANMLTLPEGIPPLMNMGLVKATGRHTALDSTVVFHEYTHGVTNRLVGGPRNVHAMGGEQGGGMNEGLSDYFACTVDDTDVVGAWVMDKPNGLRGFPYTSDFPDTFADLGTGRYSEVHNIGEIWAATLLEMNRKIGKDLGLALVVDALKISPANPSFLDMRDAILIALDDKLTAGQLTEAEHASARTDVWAVFGRFGMGPAARSDGPSLEGIEADFSTAGGPTPPRPQPRPSQPAGGGISPLPLLLHLVLGHIGGGRGR